jgi:hypothetical protein
MKGFADRGIDSPIDAPEEGSTRIIEGDWCLEVYVGKGFTGYRRYHKHEDRWFTVKAEILSLVGTNMGRYVCQHCNEAVPDTMEGYVNLARYSLDAN